MSEELEELRTRINRAITRITELKTQAASKANTAEYTRLEGKEDGLRIALGYLEEMSR